MCSSDLLLQGTVGLKLRLAEGGGSSDYTLGSAESLSSDRWYHVAATYDAGAMKVFVDGQLSAVGAYVHEGSFDFSIPGTVGAMNLLNSNDVLQRFHYFPGRVDDLLILNRALSPDEVQVHYQSKAPFGSNQRAGCNDRKIWR